MAPIPPAARMRLMRERRKRDPEKCVQMKLADAERKRRQRAEKILSAEEVTKRRQSGRSRTAKWRLMKKATNSALKPDLSLTPQALGKAVRRVKNAFPSSPRKAKLVLSKLNISQQLLKKTDLKDRKDTDMLINIESFYCRDDISRQAPGKKDYVTLWTKEGETVKQKGHLMMTVFEAYQIFKLENPNLKIGKSKFAQCRPKHVLTMSNLPQNVCLCRVHEDLNFLLEAALKLNITVPKTTSMLVTECVCDEDSEKCMLSKYDDCLGGKVFVEKLIEENKDRLSDAITWCQWRTVDNIVIKAIIDDKQVGDLLSEMG